MGRIGVVVSDIEERLVRHKAWNAWQQLFGQILVFSPSLMFSCHEAVKAATVGPESELVQTAQVLPTTQGEQAAPPQEARQAAVTGAKPGISVVQVNGSLSDTQLSRDETAARIIVSRDDLLRYGDTNVAEALKRVPGVTVGSGGDLRLRGLGSGYTQILLDSGPVPPGFLISSISPENIERVEIMHSATAEFSTQAIAGTINIILRKSTPAARTTIKLGGQRERTAWGGVGSFSFSDKADKRSHTINGSFVDARSDQATAVYYGERGLLDRVVSEWYNPKRITGRARGFNLSPRVNWMLGQDNALSSQSFVGWSRTNLVGVEDTKLISGRLPLFTGVGATADTENSSLRSELIWNRKLESGSRIEARFGASYLFIDNEAEMNQYLGPSVALQRVEYRRTRDAGLTTRGKYSRPYASAHSIALGWDGGATIRRDGVVQKDKFLQQLPRTPIDVDEDLTARIYRLAAFVQDEWEVSPRLSAYFGFRWEGIETRVAGYAQPPASNRAVVFSPLVQTLWKLPDRKNEQLRLALTRTFRAPSLSRLTPYRDYSANNSASDPDNQGNPQLKPELATGIDATFESYFSKNGMLSVRVYARRLQHVINPRVTQVGGIWLSRPENIGDADTHGVEFESKLPLQELYPQAPKIELAASLARNWSSLSEVPGPNNRLSSQTPSSATFRADYVANATWTAGASFAFQGAGPVRLSEYQYAFRSATRSLDVYWLWRLRSSTQLRMSVSNALGQDSVSQSRYLTPNYTTDSKTTSQTSPLVRVMLEMSL